MYAGGRKGTKEGKQRKTELQTLGHSILCVRACLRACVCVCVHESVFLLVILFFCQLFMFISYATKEYYIY